MRRIALFVSLVSVAGCHRQAPPATQSAASPVEAAASAAPVPDKVVRTQKGRAAPTIAIDDLATGKPLKLADLKGKPLLVSLWATWCVPCVRELPTLDRLAAAMPGVQVVAVSEDTDGARVVAPFLQKNGIKVLKPYHDNDNGLMLQLKEAGLPVTLLYDKGGKEVWRVPGDMDWSGARAKALLAEAGA